MLIYLASPYTSPNRNVEDRRAKAVTVVAGQLVKLNYHIFCPIAHCHKMNRYCGLGGKFEYWQEFDEKMISVCGEFWIVTLEGWVQSAGIEAETKMAADRGMILRFVDPVYLDITREPHESVPLAQVLDHWKKVLA